MLKTKHEDVEDMLYPRDIRSLYDIREKNLEAKCVRSPPWLN